MLLPVSMSFGREIKELSYTEIRTGLQVRSFQGLVVYLHGYRLLISWLCSSTMPGGCCSC